MLLPLLTKSGLTAFEEGKQHKLKGRLLHGNLSIQMIHTSVMSANHDIPWQLYSTEIIQEPVVQFPLHSRLSQNKQQLNVTVTQHQFPLSDRESVMCQRMIRKQDTARSIYGSNPSLDCRSKYNLLKKIRLYEVTYELDFVFGAPETVCDDDGTIAEAWKDLGTLSSVSLSWQLSCHCRWFWSHVGGTHPCDLTVLDAFVDWTPGINGIRKKESFKNGCVCDKAKLTSGLVNANKIHIFRIISHGTQQLFDFV